MTRPPPTSNDFPPVNGIGWLGTTGPASSSTGVGANGSPTTKLSVSGLLTLPESSSTTSDAVYWPVGSPGAFSVGLVVTTTGRLATVQRYRMTDPPMSLEFVPESGIAAPGVTGDDG